MQKGTSISLPTSRQSDEQQQHILKRKQPTSLDEEGKKDEIVSLNKDLTKNRLIRSNDILLQSSLETLLDMLKAYSGIKDCSEETQIHLNMVIPHANGD